MQDDVFVCPETGLHFHVPLAILTEGFSRACPCAGMSLAIPEAVIAASVDSFSFLGITLCFNLTTRMVHGFLADTQPPPP